MNPILILASKSAARAKMLKAAGLEFEMEAASIDETTIKETLVADKLHPRDVADALADAKAAKISGRRPEALVLGCDQVLAFEGTLFTKAKSQAESIENLYRLRKGTHELYSAAVIYEKAKPVWRHIGRARLTMRDASDAYIHDYVLRNWDSVRSSVGSYKIEEEGVRLFSKVDGDHFTILGLPLIEVLSYLMQRGTLRA